MSDRELQAYKARMDGKKPGLVQPFTPGDDSPDYIDKGGKAWMAKKDEKPEELMARAAGQKIPSKTTKEGEEDEQV